MRNSVRAIIIRDDSVLTMFRRKIKDGKLVEYYVIPGGGIENGETNEQTIKRELKEEMSLDITILGCLGVEKSEIGNATYYHCKIDDNAQPKLGGEELDRMSDANFYKPCFVKIDDLEHINLYGKEFVFKAVNKEYKKL